MTQTSEVRVSLADVPEMLSVLRAATAMHDAIFYLDGEFLANAPTQVVLAYSDLQAALRNLSLGHRAEPIRADADTEL